MNNLDEQAAYEAFEAYRSAKLRVERTMDFSDAVQAGIAWKNFVNLFVGPEHQMRLETNVVPFRRRAKA